MHVPNHRRLVLGGLLVLVIAGCRGALQLEESDHPTVLSRQLMTGSSPSARGELAVRTLTYGHGDDKNAPICYGRDCYERDPARRPPAPTRLAAVSPPAVQSQAVP